MASVGTLNGASCLIAAGTSYGMVDATDARALDAAGLAALTGYPLRLTRASFNAAPQAMRQMMTDRADIASKSGLPPPVVDAAVDGSGPVVRIAGDVSFTFEGRGFGANAALSNALGLLLSSGLADVPRSAGTSQSFLSSGTNTATIAGGDIAEVVAGDILAVVQTDGTYRFVKITRNNAGSITTLEPHGIADTTTATSRSCHIWYSPVDGDADGAALVCQFAHPDGAFTYLGVGGRLKSFKISKSGGTALEFEATVSFTDGLYTSAVVLPIAGLEPLPLGVTGTTPLRTLVAPVRISADHSAAATPKNVTAADLPIRDWSVEVAVVHEPNPNQGTRSGVDGASITVASLSGSFTQQAPTSGADWREIPRLGQKRAGCLASAGANAAGNGMGVWIGSVEVGADPGVTFEDERRTQTVAFRAGDYDGDYESGAPEHANQPWAICFVC